MLGLSGTSATCVGDTCTCVCTCTASQGYNGDTCEECLDEWYWTSSDSTCNSKNCSYTLFFGIFHFDYFQVVIATCQVPVEEPQPVLLKPDSVIVLPVTLVPSVTSVNMVG